MVSFDWCSLGPKVHHAAHDASHHVLVGPPALGELYGAGDVTGQPEFGLRVEGPERGSRREASTSKRETARLLPLLQWMRELAGESSEISRL
jgi:hypothetical protein